MSKEIIAYLVVAAENSYKAEERINKLIVDGWQPFGSASSHPAGRDKYTNYFFQPMVKYRIDTLKSANNE